MAAAWRTALGGLTALALATGAAGCSGSGEEGRPGGSRAGMVSDPHAAKRPARLIGDGSTAETGPQPRQPKPRRLAPGEKPPQFVVFSWDGAGEDGQKLFSHFRAVGKKYHAAMTYFLSGVYMLPEEKRKLYDPPRHRRGASDIGFNDVKGVRATVEQLRGAWLDGSEIGTHFNGHFCGADRGVGTWSTEEWTSEIRQAESFVKHWRTNAGLKDEPSLPFDYSKELVGGRAPCLEGQRRLIPAAKDMGFRYDASSEGGRQVWPKKIHGLWDFPLQDVPVPGRDFETLSMDYNFLANQSDTTNGDPDHYDAWGKQMRDGLMAGFNRAYHGNRAPFFVGDHFESWNGGTYMRAVESVIKKVCTKEDVRCVSFKQLADWMDAQDPAVLARLRKLDVGEAPKGGWERFLSGRTEAGEPAGRPGKSHEPAERPGRSHEPAESHDPDEDFSERGPHERGSHGHGSHGRGGHSSADDDASDDSRDDEDSGKNRARRAQAGWGAASSRSSRTKAGST
ncbi:hypothetical protein [Streptomyces cinnamoneus]|uniref:hypothetical protein n=1 Tax=Streptomyces cinnamoneus TaxID=53446 RepID=UPI001EFD9311|nr:hypothetical protein [Streptomyces cinnamoneus]